MSCDKIELGPPYLTKFERAVIVGIRALQISIGAPPLIDVYKLPVKDPIYVAKAELEKGLLPISVRRRSHGGKEALIPLDCLLQKEKEVLGGLPRLM